MTNYDIIKEDRAAILSCLVYSFNTVCLESGMRTNIARWGTVLGALPRIMHYLRVLRETPTYFERLRIVNAALGPHWVFRLADAVGTEKIRANRPSWHRFYIEDYDGPHCPLDPGAPETASFLGRRYSDMDMAFYAGMGFDGYRLALETPRIVTVESGNIAFDGRYNLEASGEMKVELQKFADDAFVPKEHYYGVYAETLDTLFAAIDEVLTDGMVDEEKVERAIAGCLIVMCGGHQGCQTHPSQEDRFAIQMESLIIFRHAMMVMKGQSELETSAVHASIVA